MAMDLNFLVTRNQYREMIRYEEIRTKIMDLNFLITKNRREKMDGDRLRSFRK